MGSLHKLKIIKNDSFQQKYFGNYILQNLVAIGGMAEIYDAVHKETNKQVIIKKILPNFARSEDFVRMFLDEAKILSQLDHENIVKILDFGKNEDDYFIVLDRIEGISLRIILDRLNKINRTMPVDLAIYVSVKILNALDYAHNKKDANGKKMNIIHRDIAPDNILLSKKGEVKIIDFGIAKSKTNSSITKVGQLKGKIGYMAPEQVFKENIDARSDLYSVGAILYEMITGCRLFKPQVNVSLRKTLKNLKIKNPRKIDGNIPKQLEKIILRSLRKKPIARFQTASDFQIALINYLEIDNFNNLKNTSLATFVNKVFQLKKVNSRVTKEASFSEAKTGISKSHSYRAKSISQSVSEKERSITLIKNSFRPAPRKAESNGFGFFKSALITAPLVLAGIIILLIYSGFSLDRNTISYLKASNNNLKIYQNALSLYDAGEYEKALYELQNVLFTNLNEHNQYFNAFNETLKKIDNPELTLNILKQYSKSSESVRSLFKTLGYLYLAKGHKNEALNYFKGYLEIGQNDAYVRDIKKIILGLEGKKEVPNYDYGFKLDARPNENNLVSDRHVTKPAPKAVVTEVRRPAISQKQEAITTQAPTPKKKARPKRSPKYSINKGDRFFKKEDYNNALNHYLQAKNVKRRDPSLSLKLGRTYSKLLIFDKAIKEYKTAVKLNPKSKDAYKELGFVYYRLGEVGKAKSMLGKYLKYERNRKAKKTVQNFIEELN